VVTDVSFISLCALAASFAAATVDGADLIVLVKPQFEAGRGNVGRGGVVRDDAVRIATVRKVIRCMSEARLGAQGLIRSPIPGADGNVEYLLWLTKGKEPAVVEVPD
jgi:23S rRNA (cytidine1920-2'-O)/16S rRNA (cytidine1409-2'-O)-methyltransferase